MHDCIESVLSQSFADFELILVDDGSPDGCPQICDEYAQKDARVVVIHQANAGVSTARNAGLQAMRGEYFTFLDGDDALLPDGLAQLWQGVVQYPDIDVVQGQVNRDGTFVSAAASEFLGKHLNRDEMAQYTARKLLGGWCYARLVKSSIVREHHLSFWRQLCCNQDTIWNRALKPHLASIYYTEAMVYYYRYNPTSTVNDPTKGLRNYASRCRMMRIAISTESPSAAEQRELLPFLLASYYLYLYKNEQHRSRLHKLTLGQARWLWRSSAIWQLKCLAFYLVLLRYRLFRLGIVQRLVLCIIRVQ